MPRLLCLRKKRERTFESHSNVKGLWGVPRDMTLWSYPEMIIANCKKKVNSCYANFALFSCKFFKFVYPVQTSSYKTLLSSSQLRHQKSYKPNFLARKSACAFLNTKALRICLRIACSAASPS